MFGRRGRKPPVQGSEGDNLQEFVRLIREYEDSPEWRETFTRALRQVIGEQTPSGASNVLHVVARECNMSHQMTEVKTAGCRPAEALRIIQDTVGMQCFMKLAGEVDSRGCSPLLSAAKWGCVECIEVLLEPTIAAAKALLGAGSQKSVAMENMGKQLWFAVIRCEKRKNTDQMRKILEVASLAVPFIESSEVLKEALYTNAYSSIEALLLAGMNVTAQVLEVLVECEKLDLLAQMAPGHTGLDRDGNILQIAIYFAMADYVRVLLENRVSEANSDGAYEGLRSLCKGKQFIKVDRKKRVDEILDMLIHNGLDVNCAFDTGCLLDIAIEASNEGLVLSLIEHGATVSPQALLQACTSTACIMRVLLSHSSSPPENILIRAVAGKNLQVVEAILDNGISADQCGSQHDICRLLLQHRARIPKIGGADDWLSPTFINMCQSRLHLQSLSIVVPHTPDRCSISWPQKDGSTLTPLEIALPSNNFDLALLLLQVGVIETPGLIEKTISACQEVCPERCIHAKIVLYMLSKGKMCSCIPNISNYKIREAIEWGTYMQVATAFLTGVKGRCASLILTPLPSFFIRDVVLLLKPHTSARFVGFSFAVPSGECKSGDSL
ncbi:hypothetical protein Pelo_7524 [Pelomyxa schiedti]|nr:hypothetical protein Pelo_7524 [Pelomyxa schiedti]